MSKPQWIIAGYIVLLTIIGMLTNTQVEMWRQQKDQDLRILILERTCK